MTRANKNLVIPARGAGIQGSYTRHPGARQDLRSVSPKILNRVQDDVSWIPSAYALRMTVVLFLFFLLPLSTLAEGAEVQIVTAPKSGITAWLVEDDSLPMFTLKLTFTGAGASRDPDGQEGRA